MPYPLEPNFLKRESGLANQRVSGHDVTITEDVYESIVKEVHEICQSMDSARVPQPPSDIPSSAAQISTMISGAAPLAPANLQEAGLSLPFVADMILKLASLQANVTSPEISRQIRLPVSIIVDAVAFLDGEGCLQAGSHRQAGATGEQILLSELGRHRSRQAFARSRYVGPAPVPLSQYANVCRVQSPQYVSIDHSQLAQATDDLVLDDTVFAQLGAILCGGCSALLYGASGNGKSEIGRRLGKALADFGGDICVPFAVLVDDQILAIHDPVYHREEKTLVGNCPSAAVNLDEPSEQDADTDARWCRVKRPFIELSGACGLQVFELEERGAQGYFRAPLAIKANGGTLMIDDLSPTLPGSSEFLNRWIWPLEQASSRSELPNGRKFTFPIEQLTIFCTNMDLGDFGNEGFLRRIHHKLEVGPPSESQFKQIFRRCCQTDGIAFDEQVVTQLLKTQYDGTFPRRSCDPRDLLDRMQSICRFEQQTPYFSEDLLVRSFRAYRGKTRASR